MGSVAPDRGESMPALAALRPGHQAKNLLVLLPWLAHHGPFDGANARTAFTAFLAFALVATGGYLVNDVRDREADRAHPRKRRRAVASGALGARHAWGMAGMLLMGGIAAGGLLLPPHAWAWLALYVLLALAYTFWAKRVVLLDVLVLTAFYLLRILFGGTAFGIWISPWLLGLTGFLFLSLAFLKRYAELSLLTLADDETVPGRGYVRSDLAILRIVGPTCGCLAVLVLALYVQSERVVELYARPTLLWLAAPALLYGVVRMWLLANRGERIDDPVAFALGDLPSWIVAAWILAVGVAAAA